MLHHAPDVIILFLAVNEDFVPPQTSELTLNGSRNNINISIAITNDDVFELSESFIVELTYSGLTQSSAHGTFSKYSNDVIIIYIIIIVVLCNSSMHGQ